MKRPCFTLIELLVVIAVIALLMAILVPFLQESRHHAKTTLCGSNIRQLVLGLAMYEAENQTFPYGFHDSLTAPPGGYPGYIQCDRTGWWWFNHTTDYSMENPDKSSILLCPSKKIKNRNLKNNVLCGNYGVNRSICKSSDDIQGNREEFVGTPLGSGDIPHPSRTILIVDSGYSLLSWWHATDIPPVSLGSTIEDTAYVPGLEINKEKHLWPGQEWDAVNGRHPNKTVNVGFADGHIDRVKAVDLFVEKTGDECKNKSPLWVPK